MSMQSVGVGFVMLVVAVVGRRPGEVRVEAGETGESRGAGVGMVSAKSGSGDVLVTDETKFTQLAEVTDVTSSLGAVIKLMLVDKSDGVSRGDEAVSVTQTAASPPAAGVASTEKTSGVTDRFVGAVET